MKIFDRWNIKLLPVSFSPWMHPKGHSEQKAALMSGGFESSVATHILREKDLNV
jgi:hypothetical protein